MAMICKIFGVPEVKGMDGSNQTVDGRFSHGRFGQAIFKGGHFGQISIFNRFNKIINH